MSEYERIRERIEALLREIQEEPPVVVDSKTVCRIARCYFSFNVPLLPVLGTAESIMLSPRLLRIG